MIAVNCRAWRNQTRPGTQEVFKGREINDAIELHESPNASAEADNTTRWSSTSEPGSAGGHDALPPTDGGHQAWLLLAGCFVMNILIWGFAFSFGVLQEYYSTHEPFASNPQGIPAIATTASGLMYLLMPVYFSALQRWPRWKRYCTWASLPVVAAAIIGASFANKVSQLIACQGVLFANGGNLLFVPTVTYLDEWFVRKKGLAIGIMWAGDGAGGVIMPLVIQALLNRYGFRTALRAIASAMVLIMIPLLFFTASADTASSAVRPISTSFLQSPTFWLMQTFNIIQGSGYLLPTNYLPTYMGAMGLPSSFGPLTLVMVNLASVFGCVAVGWLVDHVEVTNVLMDISVGSSIAVLAIWGVATSIAPLCLFSLLYGLTAGSYSSPWSGMITKVQRKTSDADANVVFSFLAAGRGIGAILSGPLSEALLSAGSHADNKATVGYDTQYGNIVIFAGCTAFAGGATLMLRRAGLL